jgi:hypothetical protein
VIFGDYRQLQNSTCAANVVARTDTALTCFLQKLTRSFGETYSPSSNPEPRFPDVKKQALFAPNQALQRFRSPWKRGAFFAHGFPWVTLQDWTQLGGTSSKADRIPP